MWISSSLCLCSSSTSPTCWLSSQTLPVLTFGYWRDLSTLGRLTNPGSSLPVSRDTHTHVYSPIQCIHTVCVTPDVIRSKPSRIPSASLHAFLTSPRVQLNSPSNLRVKLHPWGQATDWLVSLLVRSGGEGVITSWSCQLIGYGSCQSRWAAGEFQAFLPTGCSLMFTRVKESGQMRQTHTPFVCVCERENR